MTSLPREPLGDWLRRIGLGDEAVAWAEPYACDWERAWLECARSDWLLALAIGLAAERRVLVLAAAGCARTALDALPREERRPLCAIEAAEQWARGEGSVERCRETARELDAIGIEEESVAAAVLA